MGPSVIGIHWNLEWLSWIGLFVHIFILTQRGNSLMNSAIGQHFYCPEFHLKKKA